MFRVNSFILVACLSVLCLLFAFASCATGGGVVRVPEWTSRGQHPQFPDDYYKTAVGHGNSRHAAERDALGRLVTTFGASVRVNDRLIESYREVARSGVATEWAYEMVFESDIEVIAGMHLMGASIGPSWEDGRGTHFALAVLDRATAVMLYLGRVRANRDIIDNLTNFTNVPVAARNTIEGFSRFHLAAMFADMSFAYEEILLVLGVPRGGTPSRRGEYYRRIAQDIAATIPIGINIRTGNDMAGRIQGAFAGVLSEFGLRTVRAGEGNPRYMLDVDIIVQPFDEPGSPFVFVRVEVIANLINTGTRAVVLPYNFIGEQEGHTDLLGAADRAFSVAEARIGSEYMGYLLRLISRR